MVSLIIQKTLRQIPISKNESLNSRIRRDRNFLLKWNALWMAIICVIVLSIIHSELNPIVNWQRIEPLVVSPESFPNPTIISSLFIVSWIYYQFVFFLSVFGNLKVLGHSDAKFTRVKANSEYHLIEYLRSKQRYKNETEKQNHEEICIYFVYTFLSITPALLLLLALLSISGFLVHTIPFLDALDNYCRNSYELQKFIVLWFIIVFGLCFVTIKLNIPSIEQPVTIGWILANLLPFLLNYFTNNIYLYVFICFACLFLCMLSGYYFSYKAAKTLNMIKVSNY